LSANVGSLGGKLPVQFEVGTTIAVGQGGSAASYVYGGTGLSFGPALVLPIPFQFNVGLSTGILRQTSPSDSAGLGVQFGGAVAVPHAGIEGNAGTSISLDGGSLFPAQSEAVGCAAGAAAGGGVLVTGTTMLAEGSIYSEMGCTF
jgi:hypothetical protein